MSETLAWVTAVISAAWGIGHIVPTRAVVAGFGDITQANRRIITMEWVAEGVTLVFLGVLVAVVTLAGDSEGTVVEAVYVATAGMLFAIGGWTAMTAGRGGLIFFKLCPVVTGTAAVLLLIAALG
jgi:hypothetical protein